MIHNLRHPNIDPVIFRFPLPGFLGKLAIRWYSLLYVGGFIVARSILRRLARESRFLFTQEDIEQLILWILIGAVVGARIIYCVVYDPRSLLANPFFLFEVYNGGLSFHGGLLGVIVAALIFARKRGIPFWNLADAMALATPTGLGMGRIGNFINGELYGRISYVPWAMIFPNGGPEPRHPSQIYELLLEGVLLFTVLWLLKPRLKRDGEISMVFLMGYSFCRFVAEFFREPDAQVGYLWLGMSMGQILSLIMFGVSGAVAIALLRRPEKAIEALPKKKKKKR